MRGKVKIDMKTNTNTELKIKMEMVINVMKTNMKMRMNIRVFHKNTFLKEKVVHTLTTPYRAYINHTQKIFFLGQVYKVPPLSQK